jgi:hypothetical protein
MNRSTILGGTAGVLVLLSLAALSAVQGLRPLIDQRPTSSRPAAALRPATTAHSAPAVPLSLVPEASYRVAQRRHVLGHVVLDLRVLESIDAAEEPAIYEAQPWAAGRPPVCWLFAENSEQQAEALAILTQGACAEVRIAY